MDVRDNIIKKVMGALVKVGQEVSDIVQDTLIMSGVQRLQYWILPLNPC